MTTFQCNFPGATSKYAVAKPKPARRCGAEPKIGKVAAPWNCTKGAKQPFYWFQKERNNVSKVSRFIRLPVPFSVPTGWET